MFLKVDKYLMDGEYLVLGKTDLQISLLQERMEYKKLLLVCVLAIMTTVFAVAETIVTDNKSGDFVTTGSWSTGSFAGYHVTDYRWVLTVTGSATASAGWVPTFESAGTYEVAIW